MDTATLNLLIGGGIGIISGSIASIISHVFQSNLAEKKRNWDLFDYERNLDIQNKKSRLSQIENLTLDMYGLGLDYLTIWERRIIDFNSRQEMIEKAILLTRKKVYLQAIANIIDCVELEEYITEYSKLIERFISNLYSAIDSKDENKRVTYFSQMATIFSEWKKPFNNIISKTDDIQYEIVMKRI